MKSNLHIPQLKKYIKSVSKLEVGDFIINPPDYIRILRKQHIEWLKDQHSKGLIDKYEVTNPHQDIREAISMHLKSNWYNKLEWRQYEIEGLTFFEVKRVA